MRRVLQAPLAAGLLAVAACQPHPSPASSLPEHVPTRRAPSALDAWLKAHPAVAAAIVWETEIGPIPWTAWEEPRRAALDEAFLAEAAALQGTGDPRGYPVDDPPANLAASHPSRQLTVLDPRDAWRIFAAHVGHSLALELLHTLPWSLADDTPESLAALLDSRSMFAWKAGLRGYLHGGYHLEQGRAGWVIPSPPTLELAFLRSEHLLGPTRLATIEALVAWAGRLHHVTGRIDNDTAERAWQYRGFAPVSRVLAGTGPDRRRVTAGCWGTTGLFIAVLRAANIPVRLVNVRGQGRAGAVPCSHAQPWFVSEGRWLSHGDDPYSAFVTSLGEGAVPPARLLLDKAAWNAWFGEGVDPAARCANIGRATQEIAIETLPPFLMKAYCDDERSGADHRAGKVARVLGSDAPGSAFSVAELERQRLWARLGEKARATGACGGGAKPGAPPAPDPFELEH